MVLENFKKRLDQKKPLIGTIQALNSPEVSEILASAGFDWIWVDLEHSAIDIQGAQHIIQTAGNKSACVVRVPASEEVWIKKILDTGPAGIIVPQVKSALQAAAIVRFSRYSPLGTRSVGIARAHGYGLDFKNYVENANQSVALILQIEHIDAVNEIEAIVKVPGIDALLVGPYDLSASMGKIGQVNDPDIQKQIEKVRKTCLKAGMPLGIFTINPEDVNQFIKKGYTLIAVGIDTLFLGQTVKQTVEKLKK